MRFMETVYVAIVSTQISTPFQIFAACPELSSSSASPTTSASVLRKKFTEALALLDTELSLFKTFVFKRMLKRCVTYNALLTMHPPINWPILAMSL